MSEMTPEKLREWANDPDDTQVGPYRDCMLAAASAWEADLAFANEDGTSMNNQLIEAHARIEAPERALEEVEHFREIEAADFDRAHGEVVKQLLTTQARIEALLEHRRVFKCETGLARCPVCDELIAALASGPPK